MAKVTCRWRNVLICLCTQCICMSLVLIFIVVTITLKMHSYSSRPMVGPKLPDHFVAPGLVSLNSVVLPTTFWDLHQNGASLWNQLQLTVDLHFNPILHPNYQKKEHKGFPTSLLKKSFSEVSDSHSARHNFGKLTKPLQEFVRHMHRREYSVLLEPKGVCGAGANNEKEAPLLLLAIKSTELNFKNRQAIRQTWGQAGWVAGQRRNNGRAGGEHGAYVRRVFLLAKESTQELDVNFSELLQLENQHYGDILQWNFEDTFFNLTLKDVLFWKWFTLYCRQAHFVFKGDDDVFVNTPVMITYLLDELKNPHTNASLQDFMVGDVINAALPNQVNTSKYFIPDSFYKGLYPPYAGGGGVLYSGVLAKRLFNMSKRVHLFPIDDVYVGMCMLRLNTSPVHQPAFLTFDFPEKEETERCAYHKILLVHKRSPDQLIQLWKERESSQSQCWNIPLRTERPPQKATKNKT